MSKFDMFTRALALGRFREAFIRFFVEEAALPPGQHCQNFSCATGNNNCPSTCFCNTNRGTCVSHK
jgi:hypothetical protein